MSEIKIRSFGNDTIVQTISELKNSLINDYKGLHVSIVLTRPSGLKRVVFVTVAGGKVFHTYSNEVVDFDAVSKEIYGA